jgi:hypothetical protein
MPAPLNPAKVCFYRPMNIPDTNPSDRAEAAGRQVRELYRIEMNHRETGTSEFVYDVALDVFRFPEDGRFAFCDEFADWPLLREREYVAF